MMSHLMSPPRYLFIQCNVYPTYFAPRFLPLLILLLFPFLSPLHFFRVSFTTIATSATPNPAESWLLSFSISSNPPSPVWGAWQVLTWLQKLRILLNTVWLFLCLCAFWIKPLLSFLQPHTLSFSLALTTCPGSGTDAKSIKACCFQPFISSVFVCDYLFLSSHLVTSFFYFPFVFLPPLPSILLLRAKKKNVFLSKLFSSFRSSKVKK